MIVKMSQAFEEKQQKRKMEKRREKSKEQAEMYTSDYALY